MSTTNQLALFEPTGPEVLHLARKPERDARRARDLADSLDCNGWQASAGQLRRTADWSQTMADEMYMLAEFEALAGLTK